MTHLKKSVLSQNSGGPMENANMTPFVQKSWRILRHQQHSIKPGTGHIWAQVPLWLSRFHTRKAGSALNILRASYNLKK